MVHHIVLLKLRPGIGRDDPRVCEGIAALRALPGQIEGIERWELGWNFTERDIAYDVGLYAGFASRAALAAYGPHPAHRAAVEKLKPWFDWVLCDFDG